VTRRQLPTLPPHHMCVFHLKRVPRHPYDIPSAVAQLSP
jgi:hypothetical protein